MSRWFPTPSMAAMPGAGIDVSDSSIKWLSLKEARRGWEVDSYGSRPLPSNIVAEGVVQDSKTLIEALKEIKSVVRTPFVHAALPEETAYVFSMDVVDIHDRQQVLNIIEFELEGRVPLRASQAVFDYDVIAMHPDGVGAEIGVTVFPADVVQGYTDAFRAAGMQVLSLELEARSVARAIIPPGATETVLLADFGRARTGFVILKRQVPIFTSTVAVGGDALTKIIREQLSATEAEAVAFKNEQGLVRSSELPRLYELMMGTAAALADEIVRHFQYWDTRRNEHGDKVTPVARVLLAGGSANLKGLPEYITGRIQAPAELVNVWTNTCLFEDYIPPIDRHYSLGYATAIGLALRSV